MIGLWKQFFIIRTRMERPTQLLDDDNYAMDSLRSRTPMFLYVLTLFSALGGFLFGYDTGVIAGMWTFQNLREVLLLE